MEGERAFSRPRGQVTKHTELETAIGRLRILIQTLDISMNF